MRTWEVPTWKIGIQLNQKERTNKFIKSTSKPVLTYWTLKEWHTVFSHERERGGRERGGGGEVIGP